MNLSVVFEQRDFSGPRLAPGRAWSVMSMEWRAVGGPWTARLRAPGQIGGAGRLADLLRCPLTIFDERGPAWWGYVSAVSAHSGQAAARLDLAEMGNRTAVWYRDLTPDPAGGRRWLSEWAEDEVSIAAYGLKERRWSMDQASPGEAGALARAMLARYRWPLAASQVQPAEAPPDPYLEIEARGWFQTLDWTYDYEPRGWVGNRMLGTPAALGAGSASARLAQSFTCQSEAGWLARDVWVKLRRCGATDGLRLSLCAGDGQAPGAVLDWVEKPAAELQDDWTWVHFALPSGVNLAAGQPYWLVLERTGSPDPNQFYQAAVDEGQSFADGVLRLWNGTTWLARQPDADLCFAVVGVADSLSQLERMAGQAQFLRGASLALTESGVTGRLFRDGSRTARVEMERLLKLGLADGRRLLARVEPDRSLRICPQDSPGTPYALLGRDGRLRTPGGIRLAPSTQPAGRWLRVEGLDSPEGSVFAETVRWDPAGGLRANP